MDSHSEECGDEEMSDDEDLDCPDDLMSDGIEVGHQKANILNKYLPYAVQIEDKSNVSLANIKANLGKTILNRELKPGCYFWVYHLNGYIQHNGRKFSKEDHITFIKLMYELITIPDIEFFLLDYFARALTVLLKKKELISRKELTLDWRPLYDLYLRTAFNKLEKHGLLRIPTFSSTVINHLIRCCKVYFSVNATREILEEVRPLICPYIPKQMSKATELLELFLPTILYPEEHENGFQLWFKELMQMWESVQVMPSWEGNMVQLFSRLSEATIGYIDWTPYIPMIFTRLLRSFHLPLQMKSVRFQSRREQYNIGAMATFIVSMMGGNRSCQEHLTKLFTSIESFYHPSNTGTWNIRLKQLISKLSEAFIRRLRFERGLMKSWENAIPESRRLNEDDISEFVKCMKSCVLFSIFSKSGCNDAKTAIKNLALLRPELIIPDVLERFYPAIETLNEPHRLLAVAQCTTGILPVLLNSERLDSNELLNILPILTMCLPGLDPNDSQKTIVTLHLIMGLVIMVPLVDCTPCLQNSNDLSEFEKELCSATSECEDFVLQYLDRCFILLENVSTARSMNNDFSTETVNHEDELIVSSMSSVFNLILNQSSTSIRELAIEKLCNFVTSRIFGVKDSGYLATRLINAATFQIDSDFMLKKLLVKVCDLIDENCSEDNEMEFVEPDKELLHNMLLLQELVNCDGRYLLPYRPILIKTLKKIVKIEDKDGRIITCHILKNILKSLTSIYLLERRSANNPHEASNSVPPIKLWGGVMKVKDIKINWHTGEDEEIEFAQELIDVFFIAEIERLTKLMNGELTLNRDQLQKSLSMIHAMLLGCLSRCPIWDGSSENIVESCTQLAIPLNIFNREGATMINLRGKNMRASLLTWFHTFIEYAQKNHEDNTPAMIFAVKVIHHLMFFWGVHNDTMLRDCRNWSNTFKFFGNPLRRKKFQNRILFLQRVYFHHQVRVLDCGSNRFSSLHQTAMIDLLNLSISHYSEVRCMAQWVLGECFLRLPFSYRKLLPNIADLIENISVLPHDKLKGLLHVILGDQHSYCLLTRRDFEVCRKLWPIVIKTPISDRPSINLLLECICNRVTKSMDTFSIFIEVPEQTLEAARALWSCGTFPSMTMPDEAEIAEGLKRLKSLNELNLKNYNELVEQHVKLLETPQLHWQNFQYGVDLLGCGLIRYDVDFSLEGLKLLLRSLHDDSVYVRGISIRSLGKIFYKLRPKCVRIDVNTKTELKNISVYDDSFDLSANWDKQIFIDQSYLGFYCWQKSLKLHAPAGDQKLLSHDRDGMLDTEKLIYDSFTSKTFIEQILKFLSAELNKESDKLSLAKCNIFKHLARNYEDSFLDRLIPHVERLAGGTLDSEKRCSIEIIAGLVSGSKHWKHAKLVKLHEALVPIIKNCLINITVELQSDWFRAICYMTENRDPRRNKWLMELLLENILALNNGSYVETNRINLLGTILADHVWKVPNLRKSILNVIQPHLGHTYQNVRNELGKLLSVLFYTNGNIPPFPNGHKGPCQRTFVDYVLPQLKAVEKSASQFASPQNSGPSSSSEDDEESKLAIALLKTICKWVLMRFSRTLQFLSPEIIELLPILCQGESYDRDPELHAACRIAIACIGYAYIPPEMIPVVLSNAVKLSKSASWRSRKSSLEYMQILIFSNLFNILQFPNNFEEIKDAVIALLRDIRPEVQQVASLTLSGFFHSQMIRVDKPVLKSFLKWSETSIKKGKDESNGDALRERHAGILGMAAFIGAHPYDIAEGMPETLVALGRHVNDPQPLQTTVRFAISNFWRTHHDNWQDHKSKFTEEQLSDISDLLVSPSYYA